MKIKHLTALASVALAAACAPIPDANPASSAHPCVASVYWEGSRLADGGRFHPDEPLIAHRTLPLGSRVRVTASNGRSAVLPVKDRGPFVRGRCVDLSRGAARILGISGLGHVTVEPIKGKVTP